VTTGYQFASSEVRPNLYGHRSNQRKIVSTGYLVNTSMKSGCEYGKCFLDNNGYLIQSEGRKVGQYFEMNNINIYDTQC
jgi:hypothetical protein